MLTIKMLLRHTLAALLLSAVPASALADLPTGPDVCDRPLSPFYRWDSSLPATPGKMLREEPMTAQAQITDAAVMRRILYTSRDVRWNAGIIPVSETLYLPKGTPPTGGWPIVAWAHGTLGVADVCAPSWTTHIPRDATYINQWLKQGFAVVATDYQGLGGPGPHPYLIWEAEGRSVLDAVRSALQAYPERLANQLIISGQSQGSGASLGASRIAPDYAPELNLQATIATSVVVTFPDGPVKRDNAHQHKAPARFDMLRLLGGSLPDNGPAAETLVTEQGRTLLAMAKTSCVRDLGQFERGQHLDADTAFVGGKAHIDAALTSVTDMRQQRFPAPLFIATGLADRTIAPRQQYAAVAAICAQNDAVEWKTYSGITHNGTVNSAFADELAFVRSLQSGKAPRNDCSSLVVPGKPEARAKDIMFND
ncbi:lipase family protein [Phytobacter sp. V91]|uniref:lipase family protein n=1 Tax=Phytobacter sp. V91 TaxID=3369425 RepID=UPI003F5ED658